MYNLIRESHPAFDQFFTGSNGKEIVNCVLSDDHVHYVVWQGRRVMAHVDYPNAEKFECLLAAVAALNK